MKRLFFIVLIFLTNLLYGANFAVLDFMADGVEHSLSSGTYETFVSNFKPAGFTLVSKMKVRKTADDMGIQLSTATPQQMKPLMDKLGVTHIVFGKVSKMKGEYVVSVRFIKAGTPPDSAIASEEVHFTGSHVEPVKTLAQNLAKKLKGGKGGGGKASAKSARTKNEVGVIYGYLKVFPKDLGPFPNDPESIIDNINASQQFGYDTWRIPTENELALLVSEGYIRSTKGYMSDTESSGKLRLVTDKKTAEELAAEAEVERKAAEARELKRRRDEEERRRAEEAEEAAKRERYLRGRKINGLIWSDRSSSEMDWSSAKEYCEYMTEGGYIDWRLPNIDELRTLLIADRVSNRCWVSDRNNCLSADCWSCSTCTQTGTQESDGIGCSDWGTAYSDGRYSRLGDGNVWLWSSSTKSSNTDEAWVVNFGKGNVNTYNKLKTNYVRCVR